MNARKRPAEPRSRGHSPIEKRARQIAQSSAHKTTDTMPGTNATIKKATNGVTKVLEDRRGSLGYSPPHNGSNGSGSSTPVNGAPPAPSMVPKNTTPMTIASIRRIKSRKEVILSGAKPQPQLQQDSTNSVPLLSSQLKAQEQKNIELTASVQQLLGRVVELEKRDQSNRVAELEALSRVYTSKLDDTVKASVTQVVNTKFEAVQQQAILVDTRLDNKINKENETIKILMSGFNSLAEFKKLVEQQKYPAQITTLSEMISTVESNESKTYDKASKNTDAIENLEKDIEETNEDSRAMRKEFTALKVVVGQVKNFQSELGRMSSEQRKLILGQDTFSDEIKAIKMRLDVDQKAHMITRGPGKPGTKSPTDTDATAQQLKQFSDNIKELQESVEDSQANADDTAKQLKRSIEIMRALQISVQDSQALLNQLALDERLKPLEELPDTVNALAVQSTKLNKDVTALQDLVKQHHITNKSQDLQSRPSGSPVQDLPSEIVSRLAKVEDNFPVIDDALIALERTVEEHGLKIDIIPSDLPRLLNEQFSPFKQEVHQDREIMNTKLDTVQRTTEDGLKILQQEVITLQQKSSNTGSSSEMKAIKEAFESLKQETIKLQQNVMSETTLRASDISSLNEQMDSFRHNFRVLQDQYNNISTDELHGKMVHWILQHYPQSTANMQQQVASLQAAVASMERSLQNLESSPSMSKAVDRLSNEMREIKSASRTLRDRIEVLHGASNTLRQDHDTLVKDFIEPNREPLAMYGYMVGLLGKQQLVIQHMIQKFPTKDGKAQITQPDWTVFAAEQPAPLILENAGTNGAGPPKGKGKAKQ
jgi:hypothetical protein